MHRYLPALFLTYGHEIAYEAVNDRPRLKGASKYTNLGRALIGLYDLVGVSWLRKRTQLPPIAEEASGASVAGAGTKGKRGRAKRRGGRVNARGVTRCIGGILSIGGLSHRAPKSSGSSIGLVAQLLFSMRFLVQWIATEKARASIIPETFWYFSFFGGILLLAYAVYRADPVFILGQATGLIIYSRNIYFIWLGKREAGSATAT